MRLDEACAPIFGRHETFHPRWGWIKKAVDAASDATAFTGDDATLRLGVGKNQVRAIRFWGHATKALTHIDNPENSRVPLTVPSRIGTAIFGQDGWDPYTEDPGTLWLLHWLMFAPACELPVWWSAFCEFNAVEFTEQQLEDFIVDQVAGTSTWNAPHPSSLAKDVSCMLRTYAPTPGGKHRRVSFDDMVDGPLRELGLLRVVDPSSRTYRFVIGPKPTLPAEIVLYASLDFLARTESSAQTVTVSRLASEAGAPGRVFKLPETDLTDLLVDVANRHPDLVRVARPAGVSQIGFDDSAAYTATEVLRRHFAARHLGPGPRDDRVCAGRTASGPDAEALQLDLIGARTGLPLDGPEPSKVEDRLAFAQDKIDAGVR